MKRQSTLIIGGLLTLLGILGLAERQGAAWANMERLWPLVVVAGGALAVRQGLRDRKEDSLWFGVTAVLSGAVLAYVVLFGGGWAFLADWWPLFIGLAGVGWLAAWLLARQQYANLGLGCAAIGVAAALVAINLETIPRPSLSGLASYWPWLLVVAGAALALTSARRWRSHADRD